MPRSDGRQVKVSSSVQGAVPLFRVTLQTECWRIDLLKVSATSCYRRLLMAPPNCAVNTQCCCICYCGLNGLDGAKPGGRCNETQLT
eukprot:6214540-Pleurochrysis_carterae.AAC.1